MARSSDTDTDTGARKTEDRHRPTQTDTHNPTQTDTHNPTQPQPHKQTPASHNTPHSTMFGYMLFKNGDSVSKTPDEYQRRARLDIENHLKKYRSPADGSADDHGASIEHPAQAQQDAMDIDTPVELQGGTQKNKRTTNSPLLRRLKYQKPDTAHLGPSGRAGADNTMPQDPKQYSPNLTYGSSPLRKTLADSTVNTVDSSDECSSIDSGKSGCSLSQESAQQLFHQQQESLSRILTRDSSLNNSLFTSDSTSLYTSTTLRTDASTIDNQGMLSLEKALPEDFTDYYSPDLNVEKFSNGRPTFTKRPLKNWELNDIRSLLIYPDLKPEWNNKIPEVKSPYPNIKFRIQIIPNYYADSQIIEYLAHSDIYKEAKFDLSFKLKTASYIVERARLRHKQILIDSFGIDFNNIDSNTNLLNNIQYDSYFKFEWRNIIENYLLNLGIEYQCRYDFKLKIAKLKKITQEKKSNCTLDRKNSSSLKNGLYKKVLLENKSLNIDEDIKMNLWKEVQSDVYKKLNMDGWAVNA